MTQNSNTVVSRTNGKDRHLQSLKSIDQGIALEISSEIEVGYEKNPPMCPSGSYPSSFSPVEIVPNTTPYPKIKVGVAKKIELITIL